MITERRHDLNSLQVTEVYRDGKFLGAYWPLHGMSGFGVELTSSDHIWRVIGRDPKQYIVEKS